MQFLSTLTLLIGLIILLEIGLNVVNYLSKKLFNIPIPNSEENLEEE